MIEPTPTSAEAPYWLPEVMVGSWDFLATYPIVLSLIVMVVGLCLAGIGRAMVLYWGGKVTARRATDLDEKLLRIVANLQ